MNIAIAKCIDLFIDGLELASNQCAQKMAIDWVDYDGHRLQIVE